MSFSNGVSIISTAVTSTILHTKLFTGTHIRGVGEWEGRLASPLHLLVVVLDLSQEILACSFALFGRELCHVQRGSHLSCARSEIAGLKSRLFRPP